MRDNYINANVCNGPILLKKSVSNLRWIVPAICRVPIAIR